MTREAELLIDMWDTLYRECHKVITEENYDVIKKAIKALEQEPTTKNDSSELEKNSKKLEKETTKNDLGVDCISREQALRELKESAEHHANDSREEMLLRRDRDILRALPSVTPQEPILDKIREEIAELDNKVCQQFLIEDVDKEVHRAYQDCLDIIDKYKAESEEWVNFADDLIPIIDEAESEKNE